jgi:hypothetical protein
MVSIVFSLINHLLHPVLRLRICRLSPDRVLGSIRIEPSPEDVKKRNVPEGQKILSYNKWLLTYLESIHVCLGSDQISLIF